MIPISKRMIEVEKITNTNGSAIKYSDGTMICYLNLTVTDQAIPYAYGSLYQGTRRWDYPVSFVGLPVVTCGQFQWGTGASWGTVLGVESNYATLRGIDILSRNTGEECIISAMAIGRWK